MTDRKEMLNGIVKAYDMQKTFDKKSKIKFAIFGMLLAKIPEEKKESMIDKILDLFTDEEIDSVYQEAKEGTMKR